MFRLQENCLICGEPLIRYSTIESGTRREIIVCWECTKCNKEFRIKYNVIRESIKEIKY